MAHFGRPSPVKSNEFVRCAQKIADITEADVNKHTITMDAMGLPMNTIKIQVSMIRIAGTGIMVFYPYNSALGIKPDNSSSVTTLRPREIGIEHGELVYNLTVANDDFDIYCTGYATQRRQEYRK